MPGLRNVRIGVLALIAGVVLALLAWNVRSLTGVAVFTGVAVAGGAQTMAGLVQWHTHRGRVRRLLAPHRAGVDTEILIRAMVAVAAADRDLGQDEIAMIEDVSAGLLGAPFPRARIERARRQMLGKNPLDQITRLAQDATPRGAELAVKGAVWAGRADGALSAAETHLVAALAAALGVSGHRLRTCIAEADHVYDRLAAHVGKGEA